MEKLGWLMIILTPYSRENPIEISSDEYEKLVHTNEKGWSHCDSKEEYLAKLHYLRDGYIRGKITEDDFLKREEKIVVGYWNAGS